MNITKKQLRKIIAEAMYNPDTFPKSGKPIPASIISGDRGTAQKISDYSGSEDGFEPAVNLASMTGSEPAAIGLHGGYKKLRQKADKRLPFKIKEAIVTAKKLGMSVNFLSPSHPIEKGQIIISINKTYNNGANAKKEGLDTFGILITYQNKPLTQQQENYGILKQGHGNVHSGDRLFYLDYSFLTEEAEEDPSDFTYYLDASLSDILKAADKFYNNASSLTSASLYYKFKDRLVLAAEDYINLNRESIEFNRRTPEEISRFILKNMNLWQEFYIARKEILKGLSPEIYKICANNLGALDDEIDDMVYDFALSVEDIMYEKGLGEIIAESYARALT